MMEQLLNYAVNDGFPMAVAAYLLVRIEGRLENLNSSIQELTQIIGQHR